MVVHIYVAVQCCSNVTLQLHVLAKMQVIKNCQLKGRGTHLTHKCVSCGMNTSEHDVCYAPLIGDFKSFATWQVRCHICECACKDLVKNPPKNQQM